MAKFQTKKQVVISAEMQEQVDGLKHAIKETYDHEVSMSDTDLVKLMEDNSDASSDEIINLVLDAEGFEPDTDDDDQEEQETSAVKKETAPKSAQKVSRSILEAAAKIDANPRLVKALQDAVETERNRKRNSAQFGYELSVTFSADELGSFPMPGTKKDDVGANEPYDVRGPGEGSFCQDLADSTKEGREIKNELDLLTKLTGKEGNGEVRPDKWKGWSVNRLSQEKANRQTDKAALRKVIKEGLSICKRMEELKQNTLLTAKFRTEKHGNERAVQRTAVPIQVYYLTKEDGQNITIDRWVAVSTFLRVDFKKVAAFESAEEQLDAFVVKKGKKGKGEDAALPIKITNAEQAQEAFYEVVGRFDNDKFMAGIYKIINSDEGGEFLDTIFKLEKELHKITKRADMQKKYRAYQENVQEDIKEPVAA